MKKIFLLALGCSLLFAPSCKDFLQKDPTDKPSDAIFWQSKSDFEQALTGIYAYMRGPIYYKQSYSTQENFLSTMQAMLDNLSDNSVSQNTSMDGSSDMFRDVVNPSFMPGFVGAVYNFSYTGIARCNIFLDKLEAAKSHLDDADYKQFKGEALAMRGLLYHYLYVCYGSVPVVKESLNVDNMYKEKSTKEQVYQAVIDDYNDAISNLKPNEVYSARPGHITAPAVIAFRARTKLYHAYDENGNAKQSEMVEILRELEEIPSNLYALENDVLANFHTDKQERSKEIMFSLKFLKPNFRNQVDLFVGGWSVPCPTQNLVYSFPNADGSKFNPSSIPNIDKMYSKDISNAERLTIFNAIFNNRDPRLKKFITHNNSFDFSEYVTSKPADSVKAGTTSSTFFNVYKLVTPIANDGSWDGGYIWEGDQDVVLMRWAHVLLMKAEAAYESGDQGKAEGYIRDLRARYGMPAISGMTRDDLRNEIRIETCFEGLRYFDMKRWRILDKMNGKILDPALEPQLPDDPKPFTVVINPNHYDWPIPQTEIDQARENGVNLEQNVGW